ncbi:MAG: chorismate mutase [Candidatus Bathyarchaeota archaeon]|nr:chorismate mutase [Candidatus Bathyarchaeota archaeon]
MADLKQLRIRIDAVDKQLLDLLCERVKICRDIGCVKKEQGIPVRDAERERNVYLRIREQAEVLGLDPMRVEAMYREIVNMCSSVQE